MDNEAYREKQTSTNFVLVDPPQGGEGSTESGSPAADDVVEAPMGRPVPPTEKPKGKNPWGKRLLAGTLVLLLAFGAGYGGGIVAAGKATSAGSGAGSTQTITIKPSEASNTAEAIAAKVIPSVVGISTVTKVVSRDWWGMLNEGRMAGVGTGMVVDSNGYILTNSHVISDGKTDHITVQLYDNREDKGTLLWNDPAIDLAIIKIDATGLRAVELGDSDTVRIGSYAVAIGNPLGMEFDRSVTQGVISGLNRTITVAGQSGQVTMEGLMQTDASINGGNSGGPLLNNAGQVVGINTAKAETAEGLGFAIPINLAKPIIEEVKRTGAFKKAFIGIGGINLVDYRRYYPDDRLGTDTGVYVREIGAGSPAEVGGLKTGDIIVGVNDKTIETMNQLTRDLFMYKPGDTVTLKVIRDKQPLDLTIRLGLAPSQSSQ